MKSRFVVARTALLLALVLLAVSPRTALGKQADCGLLQDCGMDNFYGENGAGSGVWKIQRISGTVGLSLAPSEGWPSGPSVLYHSQDGPFDASIYQQVQVTPGLGYHFEDPFAVVDLNGQGWQPGYQINRKLGIDPYGGTDANSPNVQWSGDYYGRGKFDPGLSIDAYAQSSTITAFIRVISPYDSSYIVDVFVDSPKLDVNTGMPPIQVASPTAPPTATRPPATPRPTRVPASATSTIVTETPVPTETPTLVPSATVEPTDTQTALPTRVRRATPVPTPVPQTDLRVLALGVVSFAGLASAGLAVVLLVLAFVFWKRPRS